MKWIAEAVGNRRVRVDTQDQRIDCSRKDGMKKITCSEAAEPEGMNGRNKE